MLKRYYYYWCILSSFRENLSILLCQTSKTITKHCHHFRKPVFYMRKLASVERQSVLFASSFYVFISRIAPMINTISVVTFFGMRMLPSFLLFRGFFHFPPLSLLIMSFKYIHKLLSLQNSVTKLNNNSVRHTFLAGLFFAEKHS